MLCVYLKLQVIPNILVYCINPYPNLNLRYRLSKSTPSQLAQWNGLLFRNIQLIRHNSALRSFNAKTIEISKQPGGWIDRNIRRDNSLNGARTSRAIFGIPKNHSESAKPLYAGTKKMTRSLRNEVRPMETIKGSHSALTNDRKPPFTAVNQSNPSSNLTI